MLCMLCHIELICVTASVSRMPAVVTAVCTVPRQYYQLCNSCEPYTILAACCARCATAAPSVNCMPTVSTACCMRCAAAILSVLQLPRVTLPERWPDQVFMQDSELSVTSYDICAIRTLFRHMRHLLPYNDRALHMQTSGVHTNIKVRLSLTCCLTEMIRFGWNTG